MHKSMDKSTDKVKFKSVSTSHNNVEPLGQPWDNEDENLL